MLELAELEAAWEAGEQDEERPDDSPAAVPTAGGSGKKAGTLPQHREAKRVYWLKCFSMKNRKIIKLSRSLLQ